MPDVTLTPVGGDPWNGGAQDLHPSVAAPLTISLGPQPSSLDQNALTGDAFAYDQAPDQLGALKGNVAAMGQAAGHVATGAANGIAGAVTYPRDVMQGRVDPQSDEGIGRTLGMAGLMAGPGLGMAEEGAAGAMGGRLTVYHGSPHRFDSFDMSKVGTGEGAQAYGHGMYFTDTESVAKGYRDALSGWNIRGRPADVTDPNHVLAMELKLAGGDPIKAGNQIGNVIKYGDGSDAEKDAYQQAANMLWAGQKPNVRPRSAGHMYEVGIDADPNHFLDYDKPLNQQSQHVQDALSTVKLGVSLPPDARGSAFHDALVNQAMRNTTPNEGPAIASQQLAQAGIPGIRYLDGMSRGAGQGTSNYVLFDPARDAAINRIYARGEAAAPLTLAEGMGQQHAADPLAAILARLDAHAAANAVEAAVHPRALPADHLAQTPPDGHFLAFHGSPAEFDRFSLDHLGSGEGVQAQGHGAYFATDQNIGAHYADTYGSPRTLPDGSTVNGHMYQVAIPGRPGDFFDQGLSLHEQSPAVRDAAAPLYRAAGVDPEASGGNLVYEMRQRALESGVPFRDVGRHVSRQFQDAGIPGHSYGGAGGEPNYVVFDPSGVRIMKTYAGGLPIPGSAPIAPQNFQPTPEMFGRLLREGKAT